MSSLFICCEMHGNNFEKRQKRQTQSKSFAGPKAVYVLGIFFHSGGLDVIQ